MNTLRITEIFLSLQGESSFVGLPTVFVRLTGCPLRCVYCDSAYAFTGGENLTIDDIMSQVDQHEVHHVCVTGGEPLAQAGVIELLARLCEMGYHVSLETSGAMDISEVPACVKTVMDLKTPSSGELDKNLFENIQHLKPSDEVKIVIGNRDDYLWAVDTLLEHQLTEKAHVLFSPIADTQNPTELADWIVEDKLPVRFQMQMHKVLWDGGAGR
jgi:7-carboxy-7-deazaguanine synthase